MNNDFNRFKQTQIELDIRRSRFNLNHSHKTTFNSGYLIPIDLIEVLPGDSFRVSLSSVIRSITPAVPVMDDAFIDIFAFYVPNRIATFNPDDWKKIVGENVSGYWAPQNEFTLNNTGNTFSLDQEVSHNSLAGYYGLPVGVNLTEEQISCLPFIGYLKIWNEWFRDQNLQSPVIVNPTNVYDCVYDAPLSVNKLHDLFTSCLPSPQKGAAVSLPLGSIAPVVAGIDTPEGITTQGLRFETTNPTYVDPSAGSVTVSRVAGETSVTLTDSSNVYLTPNNLIADLSQATAATINQLRQAFAIQRMLEKDARGGSRYRELIKAHFAVNIPDSTIQVPQYLNGHRFPMNVTQVLQTGPSNSSSDSPLGTTGAFSNSSMSEFLFDKSFNEHGYIHILCCIRPKQTYSQGIPRHFSRNRRYDWYYPSFANLGEMPIYKKQLYLDGEHDNEVFGYNEAWAEYRYLENRVSGLLAPGADDLTLTPWTYTMNFSASPVLNSSFVQQSSEQMASSFAVVESNYQFLADFYFKIEATRPMPVYSIPGLIDHH